ncbi:MAG: putative membrane protein [Lentisphaeria bacterium]|jgi:putative membrane protein
MNIRTRRDYILVLIKGLAMGAADIVPGVSGGTIALITGIYDELLHSLKNLGPQALMVLVKSGFSSFWRHINGTFLLVLFAGILISIKTFASLISFCLEFYPLLVWGFFAGLIAASILLLAKQQSAWSAKHWLLCLSGACLVVIISIVKPAQLPGDWWILFFGGFIAICAMILPGISGSFILLLMGLYPSVLEAVKSLDVIAIASFGAGCACGLLVFSRILAWLLDNYYTSTLAVLIGFLVGSLNVTWPWKQTLESTLGRHGEIIPLLQTNVSPWNYTELVHSEAQLIPVVLMVGLGMALVLFTEMVAKKFFKSSVPAQN